MTVSTRVVKLPLISVIAVDKAFKLVDNVLRLVLAIPHFVLIAENLGNFK